jgi:hypothetical protein
MDTITKEAYVATETINDLINFNLWGDDFLSEKQTKRMEDYSHNYLLEFTSIGDACCIEFLGVQLWNSEDDEREYDDDNDRHAESIDSFIQTKMLRVIHDLALIEKCILEEK